MATTTFNVGDEVYCITGPATGSSWNVVLGNVTNIRIPDATPTIIYTVGSADYAEGLVFGSRVDLTDYITANWPDLP